MGDQVTAGDWLGEVDENFQPHKIMVPFTFKGTYTVKSLVEAGQYTINQTIAVLTDEDGKDIDVNMIQRWPVKRAITCYKRKTASIQTVGNRCSYHRYGKPDRRRRYGIYPRSVRYG